MAFSDFVNKYYENTSPFLYTSLEYVTNMQTHTDSLWESYHAEFLIIPFFFFLFFFYIACTADVIEISTNLEV